MTTVVLLCVICSALAGGVLLAYGLAMTMFHLFRIHSLQAAQQRASRAEAVQALAAPDLLVS